MANSYGSFMSQHGLFGARDADPFSAVQLTGKRNKDTQTFARDQSRRLRGARGQTARAQQLLMGSLNDPTSGAGAFLPFFQEAAAGAAAPALRDFRETLAGTQANVASRFGGNVSSEELRVVNRGSDLFSRNLTEALARVGPEAIAAGQAREQSLLAARRLFGAEELDTTQMLLAAIQAQKSGGNFLGKLVGTAAGGVGGFLLGGPGGAAAGASAGQSLVK